jgi:hypothetical protein
MVCEVAASVGVLELRADIDTPVGGGETVNGNMLEFSLELEPVA